MSFSKKGRKIQPKTGKDFPVNAINVRLGALAFSAAISAALHREFDGNGSAVKSIAALTGANERAVKNWFEGRNGPSGEFLVILCRNSDQVLETVLRLCGRADLLEAKVIADAKIRLRNALKTLDELRTGEARDAER